MRLIDLDPRWVGAGGDGVRDRDGNPVPERHGVGLSFDCPCGCALWVYVGLSNPIDGGKPYASPGQAVWQRTGVEFDSLTLTPSILRVGGCGWHGFVTKGGISTVQG